MPEFKITPKFKEQLIEIGVETPIKALYYFPKTTNFLEVRTFFPTLEKGVFRGIVQTPPKIIRRGKSAFARFTINCDGYDIPLICFNQTYLGQKIIVGMEIIIIAQRSKSNWVVSKVYYKDLANLQTESEYTLPKGMQQKRYRSYLEHCLNKLIIEDFLPEELHEKYKLIERKTAFIWMHIPQSSEQKLQANRYFKYEEAFIFYLNLLLRKQYFTTPETNINKKNVTAPLTEMLELLPFTLTGAQLRVLEQITFDFNQSTLMHRLLQGDVGSGKTIVALLAAYSKMISGVQVAFLAPTTILAEQHFNNAQKLFDNTDLKIAFLRSQTKKKERVKLLQELSDGEIDLLIGTHALLEDDVIFSELGFAIIDEQQRFGVEQRKKLREKGVNVDMLYMTATPIPRTLAISVFGDLSVSTIDELPAGRQEIVTKIVQKLHWQTVVRHIIENCERNEQVYVVCPLIEESELTDVSNILTVAEQLEKDLPKSIKIGVLHGKQKNEEKQTIIQEFSANTVNVLVSTTVVEVGVHVDSATLMVIYDAQQFGLSQLHQLRGRVGRSTLASMCLLISDYKNPRLQLLEQSQDGFYLAQRDLELRGPGDFFGSKQSGIPTFKILNLVEDAKILQYAKNDVARVLATFEQQENIGKIKQYIDAKKAEILEVID